MIRYKLSTKNVQLFELLNKCFIKLPIISPLKMTVELSVPV